MPSHPITPARIKRVEKHCNDQWTKHWQCLDMKNLHLWECRSQETELNSCVFKALVREAGLGAVWNACLMQ